MMIAVHVEPEVMEKMIANSGEDLLTLSRQQVIMLVFLRHFGCTFCRQGLAAIAEKRSAIEEKGLKIVYVHMTNNEIADTYFERYEIPDPTYIGDPECRFYAAFGLTKGTFTQLFGLQTWIKGFQAGVVEGHGIGPRLGDDFQMPGVFIIQNGEVIASFVHKLASDQPDYDALLQSCYRIPEAFG